MKIRKVLALVISIMMVFSIFTGCSKDNGDTSNDGKVSDKILRFGTSGYEGLMNPILSDNTYDSYACALLFESLTKLQSDGSIVGDIATIELSEDKLTYTFTLKDGIKFSDGEPLTTEDVYFTYSTIGHPDYAGPRSYAVSTLVGYEEFHSGNTETFEGIKVIDDKKISFTFKEGNASPANIECFSYGILPKHYYEFDNYESFLALNNKPLGSGVMVLEEFAPKEFIKLKRNENYWDEGNGAKIGGVYFLEVSNDTIIAALQTDQIDFGQPDASQDNFNALKGMDNVQAIKYLGNGYTFMCFNCTRPTLSDVRTRQALMYALDRKSFIDIQYGSDLASVGMAPISPVSWAFPDASELNAYDFDMKKAGELMDEAGWIMGDDGYRYKDGQKFSLTWLVYTDSAWPGTLSGLASDTWKQLGVDLKIELMDFDTVSSKTMDAEVGEKNFDIYTMGFGLSVDPDPTGALFDDDAYVKGGFNASGYKNAEAMELVYKGKTEFDQAKRAEIYKEWAKIMNREIPHVIIAYRNEIWGINNRVKGMDIGTYSDFTNCIKNITIE